MKEWVKEWVLIIIGLLFIEIGIITFNVLYLSIPFLTVGFGLAFIGASVEILK